MYYLSVHFEANNDGDKKVPRYFYVIMIVCIALPEILS